MNFGESLTIQAARYPEKTAIEDDHKSITYGRLNSRVNSLTHGLLQMGLKKGDIVCHLQRNTIEHMELLFALAKGGMIRLPLNPRGNSAEFAYLINSFEPDALTLEEDFTEVIAALRPMLKCGRYIYCGSGGPPGAISYETLATQYPPTEPKIEVKTGDPYIVQSTSGTTGFPKAVLISHGAMIYRALIRTVDFNNHSNGVNLILTLLANTASAVNALSQVYIGGKLILRNRFDPVETVQTIERKKVTQVSMVPVMWGRVLGVPNLKAYNLSSLEKIFSYGAPLHQASKEKIIQDISPHLVEVFGTTETGPNTYLMPHDQLRKIDCVGQPALHAKIKILGSDGQELPIGQEGEIVIQNPCAFMGYLRNPEATASVFKGGWFKTGDVGKFDEENYLYIVGRSKDMIISGGYNIYAEEVERAIADLSEVSEVAVIGIPDEKWGEAVKAFVVPRAGSKITEREIIEFCKTRLASYKKPQSIEFMADLPRNDIGKIMKDKLREKYWAGLKRRVH